MNSPCNQDDIARLVTFLVCCIAVLSAGNAHAQESPSPTSSIPARTIVEARMSVASPTPGDAEFLKGQLDSMRSLHDSLLSTVHWALGAVFVLTAILVGFNWFGTSRSIDREKQALRQEILAVAQSQAAELREKIVSESDSAARLATERLQAATKSTVDSLESKVKNIRAASDEQFAQIDCELIQHEALLWNLRGVPSNEFTQYMRLLDRASVRKMSNEIDTALRQILRLMDQRLTYSSSTVTELTDLLDKLPTQYSSQVAVLREALRKKLISNPPL